MALSGSFYDYPVSQFGLYCEWSAVQSSTANTSTVTLKTYLSYYTLTVGSRNDGKSIINGTEQTYSTSAIDDEVKSWKKKLICTQTVTVPHNSNGSKSCSLSASWRFGGVYSGVSIGTITASATVTLDNIDRNAPTVTLSTSNIGVSSVDISVTASAPCNLWQYSTDGGSSWTTFSSVAASSRTYTIEALSENTSYAIRVRARKTSNQIYGYSGTSNITTQGGTVINSVAAISADADTLTVVLNVTVYNTQYHHALYIKQGGATIIMETGIYLVNGANTITFSAEKRTQLLEAMPYVKSFTASIVLETYALMYLVGIPASKNVLVQTSANKSSPTFGGFAYLDTNAVTVAVTGNNQNLIQRLSALRVVAEEAVAKNGAVISSYSVVAGDKVVASIGTTINVGAVGTSGVVPVIVTAIDSRGYTASATTNVFVAAYEGLDIREATMRRINEVEATTQIDISGRISPVMFGEENANQFQSMEYRHKVTSETEYGPWQSVTASYTDTSFAYENAEFVALDADFSHHIQFRCKDKLSEDTVVITIPQGIPLMSFRKKKIGVNNRDPQAAFDVTGTLQASGVRITDEIAVAPAAAYYYDSGDGKLRRKTLEEVKEEISLPYATHTQAYVAAGMGTFTVQLSRIGKQVVGNVATGLITVTGTTMPISTTGTLPPEFRPAAESRLSLLAKNASGGAQMFELTIKTDGSAIIQPPLVNVTGVFVCSGFYFLSN